MSQVDLAPRLVNVNANLHCANFHSAVLVFGSVHVSFVPILWLLCEIEIFRSITHGPFEHAVAVVVLGVLVREAYTIIIIVVVLFVLVGQVLVVHFEVGPQVCILD